MNFELDDRLRSVRRFVMCALPSPPWTIHVDRQTVSDDTRPVAVIEATLGAGPGQMRPRAAINQGPVQRRDTIVIMLYPEMNESAAVAALEARRVTSTIETALLSGVSLTGAPLEYAWQRATIPGYLPVWNFTGVAIEGPNRGATPNTPYGYLVVEDVNVRPIQDLEDVNRWSIAANVVVSWHQGGRIPDPSIPLVESVNGDFTPPTDEP